MMPEYVDIILFLIIIIGVIVVGYLISLLIKLSTIRKNSDKHLDYVPEVSYCMVKSSKQMYTQILDSQTNENIPAVRLAFIEIGGKSSQRTEFICKKETSLGRDQSADIQINDSTVSACHATFLYEDSKLYLRDDNSTNGTLCNDLKITEVYPINLEQKNIIKMGRTKFVIEKL